jgi:hypothetical protein
LTDDALNFLLRRSLMDLDEDLEQRINWALLRWQSAKGPTEIRKAYHEFKRLVAMRSPKKVRELEEERGLR